MSHLVWYSFLHPIYLGVYSGGNRPSYPEQHLGDSHPVLDRWYSQGFEADFLVPCFNVAVLVRVLQRNRTSRICVCVCVVCICMCVYVCVYMCIYVERMMDGWILRD